MRSVRLRCAKIELVTRALAVVLIACGAPAAPPAHHAAAPPPVVPVATVPPPAGRSFAPRAAIAAPHGAAIARLALSLDGTAAISADTAGGIRLWPALDGSREPMVVELPQPRALALAAHGDGFAVFAIDQAGALVIAQLGADGVTRTRATFPGDVPYSQIAMTGAGLLAWRSDHVIARYDLDGARLDELAAKPGENIVAIAAAGRRAAAIVDRGSARSVRWLTLEPHLAWDSSFDITGFASELAIAASGDRIAIVVHGGDVARPLLQVLDRRGTLIADAQGSEVGALGFLDDETMALATGGTAVLWSLSKSPPRGTSRSGRALAVAAGRAIAAQDGELELLSPAGIEFLGYAITAPQLVREAPRGGLVLGNGNELHALDALLAIAAPPQIPVLTAGRLVDVRWLGDDDWAVMTAQKDGTMWLELADAAHDTAKVIRSYVPVLPQLAYEPTRHLLTLSYLPNAEIRRYDPATHELALVTSLPHKSSGTTVLVPLAGDDELLQVSPGEIAWLPDASKPERASARLPTTESPAAIDATGRVYLWKPGRGGELEVYERGTKLHTIPLGRPGRIVPDPHGTRFLRIERGEVEMFRLDGARAWARPLQLVQEALWLGDGGLVLAGATGIARIDPETGDVLAARCGWQLERSAAPHAFGVSAEPVCLQLAR